MWKLKALGRKLNWTKIRSTQHYIEILQKGKGAKKNLSGFSLEKKTGGRGGCRHIC